LSSLEPRLSKLGVPMYAVVGETLGADEFEAKFWKGKGVFLDSERTFYGPKIRKMGLWGMLRIETWLNIYKSKQLGTAGNLEGDGYHLGGVFVLGPGEQGIVFEHREGSWGDNVNTTQVMEAVEKMAA